MAERVVNMAIKCCYGCVAPKRHPGCHGSCPTYIEEKAEWDRLKAIHDRERDISLGIYLNRGEKVDKALKWRRNKKR